MQTAITFALLAASALYLFLKWMPASLKEKIRTRLSTTHPRLATHFETTVKKCASSCSSSCNNCETSTIVNRQTEVKPIHFIHRS